VGAFLQAPEFIRAQVFKMVGDVDSDIETQVPTGPYMFVYHWDSPEVPWSEVIAAAQTKGYVRHMESGKKWQGLNYQAIRFTKKQPERRDRLDDAGESEEEEIDGEVNSEDSEEEEEAVDADGKSKTGTDYHGEQELAKAKEDSTSKINGEHTKEASATEGQRAEIVGKKRGDSVMAANEADPSSLNGSMQGLSIGKVRQGNGNAVGGAEDGTPDVFRSVSVADKIKAWEKNSAS
jgi:hypothetical protein